MTQPHQLGYGFAGGSRYASYYKHSGQLNIGGVLGALIVGLIAAFLMGWIYMLADLYIPMPKLDAIVCVGFGVMLGAIPAGILKKMKVRNVPVSLAVVTVVAVFGFYTSWAAWEWMLLRHLGKVDFTRLFTHPAAVVHIAQAVNHEGTWRMSEHDTENTKGVGLWVIWAAEAMGIVLAAPLVARTVIGKAPFCEKCDQWCIGPTVLRRTAAVDARSLREKLEAGDFKFIADLTPPVTGTFLEFQKYGCSKCGELNTLSVVSNDVRRDKKGRVRKNRKKTVIDKLLIAAGDLQKIIPLKPVAQAKIADAPKPV